MTYLVVVATWFQIEEKRLELAKLSHLGPSNDIIISIRK